MGYTLEQFQITMHFITYVRLKKKQIKIAVNELWIEDKDFIDSLAKATGNETEMEFLYNMWYFHEWEKKATNYKEFYPND